MQNQSNKYNNKENQEYYERNTLEAILVASAFGYDSGFLMSLLFFAVKIASQR